MSPQAAPATWFCSFCLKSQHEVKKLVAGPGFIAICDECVEMSRIYMEGGTPDLSQQLPQEKLSPMASYRRTVPSGSPSSWAQMMK